MKNYRVRINGKTFNVVLESVEEVNGTLPEKKETEVKKEVSNVAGGVEVLAPIQGNVIDVFVKVGQKVKRGEVLLLIEAMKLENEVNAPCDGEVVEVLVEKGKTVANSELLVKIK